MSIEYKNFLPVSIRDTKWGDFIETFQYVADQIKDEKIKRIFDQYEIDKMTEQDFINLAINFGFPLSIYEGWSSEIEYLKREILTIIPRILNKTTRFGYSYLFHIFNLKGNVYPCYDNGNLEPAYDWWVFNENPVVINILDSDDDNVAFRLPLSFDTDVTQADIGQAFDEYTNVYRTPKVSGLDSASLDLIQGLVSLDQETYLSSLTRNIVINYEHLLTENINEFMITNTLRAYYNDSINLKRPTENLYFEPVVVARYDNIDIAENTEIETFLRDDTTGMTCIKIGATDVSETAKILLGDSKHSVINSSITGVANLIETLTSPNFTFYDLATYPMFRKNLAEKAKQLDFSEIALLDGSDNCILYCSFPKVEFFDGMYGNFRLDILDSTTQTII